MNDILKSLIITKDFFYLRLQIFFVHYMLTEIGKCENLASFFDLWIMLGNQRRFLCLFKMTSLFMSRILNVNVHSYIMKDTY